MKRPHAQVYAGIFFITISVAVIAVAWMFTPVFVAKFLLANRSIAPGRIGQLNIYRYSSFFIGILLMVLGVLLLIVKELLSKLQRLIDSISKRLMERKILDEHPSGRLLSIRLLLPLVLIGILGFLLIWWLTPFGAGIAPDDLEYFGGAKSLLSGMGYTYNGGPITHFPPLFSILLAVLNLFENDLAQAARLLNAALFGIDLCLFTLATYLSTGRRFLAAAIAALFFLSSKSFLTLSSAASSEPLFLAFLLLCILLLWFYIIKPGWILLITSSLSLGFALITRYPGMGFFPAALVIVFLGSTGKRFIQRIRDAAIWAVLAAIPLVIFFIHNTVTTGSPTDRTLTYHPLLISAFLDDLGITVFNYIAPGSIPDVLKSLLFWLVVICFFILSMVLIRRQGRDLHKINWLSLDLLMPTSCFLFSIAYLVFLYVSISFMDASTQVDARILWPVLVISTMGIFSGTWAWSRRWKAPIIWLCFLVFIVLSIAIKSPAAIRSAADFQRDGLGYNTKAWRASETMAFVKTTAGTPWIYSNGSDAISLLGNIQTLSIPKRISALNMAVNPDYGVQIETMCNDIAKKGALLVYFDKVTWRWYLPTQEEVVTTCHLPILKQFSDGTVYGVR
jgi:4-amino-4-deoxy-L-arabinose transferase-like glycosyltransferase